jgi:large subunit ribosomal protein L23
MSLRFVLHKPVITEKTMKDAVENNSYTFLVNRHASKHQIREAVEEFFEVNVERVHTTMNAGVERRTGKKRLPSMQQATKKAIVRLKSGQSIKAFEVKG